MAGKEIGEALCEHIFTGEFFAKHWEKAPLHYHPGKEIKGPNTLHEHLLPDHVQEIIERGPAKMFKDCESYDNDNFAVGYLKGASIVVNQADRYNKLLLDMCRVLADAHFHHVFAVLYLTPRNSQAVRVHTDDQDVFLLQVWGRKHWTLRNSPVSLPYTEEMLGKGEPVPPALIGDPTMSFTMEPGDVLYIPRGCLHEATTSAEPSLHITVTVPTSDYCWGVQLARSLTETIHSKQKMPEELHRLCSTPMVGIRQGQANGSKEEDVSLHLQNMMQTWLEQLNAADIIGAFQARMAKTNEGQDRSLSANLSRQTPPRVTERCRVRLMYGVKCTCKEWSKLAIFESADGGGRMELPIAASCMPMMAALTSKPKFVTDLPATDRFERLCMLQLLLMHGVLQLFTAEMPEAERD
mmetsp:Transcript_21199/g.38698  ORF Transcript_21199/g.38698 Transcript_21199/m.38698 type:complete len:410 (+) Transcript_21199:54-1283(+)